MKKYVLVIMFTIFYIFYVVFKILTDPCTYTICPQNSNICHIKLEFNTMELDSPYEMPSTAAAADGPQIGDCIYDTFRVTSPGSSAPPTICGYALEMF